MESKGGWVSTLNRHFLCKQAANALVPRAGFRRLMKDLKGIDPCCVLSFDCDFPRDIEVLPDLVDLLARYGVRASFACIGHWVRRYPAQHRRIVEAGHELLNHTETHPNLYHAGYDYARGEDLNKEFFNAISSAERRREIERCHATFEEVLGYTALGFRSPHFGALHVDDIYPALKDMGYVFSSSLTAAKRGAKPFQTEEGVWEFPLSPCPQHPFGVLDSWHSLSKRSASHRGEGELAALTGQVIAEALDGGGLVNMYFDPKDVLESGELEGVLQQITTRKIAVVDYLELSNRLMADRGR